MHTSAPPPREKRALETLSSIFADAGWEVLAQPPARGVTLPDLRLRRGETTYAVELKVASEGRSDRLIPLWSQACLQAIHQSGKGKSPLAVIAAPKIPVRVADQVLRFAAETAPGAAAGVIDFTGMRRFHGPNLEGLDSEGVRRKRGSASAVSRPSINIYSDLNQWMLKVLLAPEIPGSLLSAPRDHYRTATDLARAANVSVMSASRLVRQLQHEGYLDESDAYLNLVRREELFRGWQTLGGRRIEEAPMRLLLRGDPRAELARMLRDGRGCLALFAAADALDVGFVHGAAPHVYVERLDAAALSGWKQLVPAEAHEPPDVIIRQAPAPNSIFRGAVERDGIPVCDILQIWLDVSSHPTRGREQADLIRRKYLHEVMRPDGSHE